MIVRILQKVKAGTTRQSLIDDCCDAPYPTVVRVTDKTSKVMCGNCAKDILQLISEK